MVSDPDLDSVIGADSSQGHGKHDAYHERSHLTRREAYEATRRSAMTNMRQLINLQRQALEYNGAFDTDSQSVAMTVISGEQEVLQTRIQLALVECRDDLGSMHDLITEIASDERRSLPRAPTAVFMSMSFLGQLFSRNTMEILQNERFMLRSHLEGLFKAGVQATEVAKRLHSLDTRYGFWSFLHVSLIGGLLASAMFLAYRHGRYALTKWSQSRIRHVQKELDHTKPDSQTRSRSLEGVPFRIMWIVNTLLSS